MNSNQRRSEKKGGSREGEEMTISDSEHSFYSLTPIECTGCGCALVVHNMRDKLFCSNQKCEIHGIQWERPTIKLKKAKESKK